MARIPRIKPRIAFQSRLVPVVEPAPSQSRYDSSGRGLYDSRRWRGSDRTGGTDGLRWQVLAAAHFTCAMCGKLEGDTSQLVADHKIPHRGDPALFWDRANLWCLCKRCHDSAKQREEARARRGGG